MQNLNGRQNRRNQSAKRSGGGSGGGNSLGAEKRDEVKGIDVMAISDDEEGEESGVGRGGGRGGGRKRKKDAEAGDRMNADCNASDGADVVECDHDEEPAEDLKLVEGRGEGGGAGGNCNDGSNSAGDGRANGGKGSEDAYMLIYIRKGCRWGAASGGEDEPALPAHVQVKLEAHGIWTGSMDLPPTLDLRVFSVHALRRLWGYRASMPLSKVLQCWTRFVAAYY